VAQANVKLIVDASNAQRALRGVQKQTNQLQQSFGGLRTAIAGIGFTLLAKQTISTTSNFQALQIRMKVLTSEFNEFAGAQELVRKAQDKFNLSIVEATKGITDIFARLRPLGISLKDIETVFMGFNTIAKEAGLNATEASAAFTQLAQGLGSGRLQGDEFRSIAEQVPQLLKAISDETGIATGKLKDFASKGLLTTDVILRALAKSADEGADKIEKIMAESPAEVFKEFSNAVLELQLTLGSKLLPAVLSVTKALSSLVKGITRFIDSEGGKVTLAFIGIAAAIKGVTVVSTALMIKIAALKANFLAMSMASAIAKGNLATTTTMAFATAGGFTKAAAAATAFKLALAKTGIGLAVVGLGMLVAKLLEARNAQMEFNDLVNEGTTAMINQAIATRKKEIDELKESIKDVNPMMDALNQSAIANPFGLMTRGTEKIEKDIQKLQEEITELEGGLPNAEARELAIEFERVKKSLVDKNKELEKIIERSKIETEEGKKQFDLETRRAELIEKFGEEKAAIILKEEELNRKLEKGVEVLKKQEELAKKLDEEFKKIGQAISEGVTDALTDAVMGTKSLAQAARALLNDIARSLIRLGINQFIGGLFNFGNVPSVGDSVPLVTDTNLSNTFVPSLSGAGFANGGRPPVGQASLVGEKGAELFVPSRAGTIIPNNKLGGVTNNIVVNVNMEGGVDAQGGEEEGRQLGRLIAVAVQSEIIQQKRAGGLLA
jgi:tape measure domain-containing protein